MATIKQLSMVAAVSLSLSLLTTGEAFAFTFTNMAVSGDPFISFGLFPAINDEGTVAFSANLDTAGGSGIFTGSGGATTTTIADTSGRFSLFDGSGTLGTPAINDEGTVAFRAGLDAGGFGIFTGSGGATTTIAVSSNFFEFGVPALNNAGTVAFTAAGSAILTGNGGATTTVADTSGPFSSFGNPAINDPGTVAFSANLGDGIFTVNSGATTTIADTSDPFSFLSSPAINNAGTVAFGAFLDAGGSGIFTSSSGATTFITIANTFTTIVDTSGPFSFFNNFALNDAGTVAFSAALDTGDYGMFIGPDPVADKVIAVGDPLFGSTVTNLSFSNNGLNNTNQLAFYAQLANGTSGIFRANPEPEPPTSVPEPASVLGLLIPCALGAGLRLKH